MINSAYTAFNGIKVARTQVEVSMNNIANESTEGYKKRSVVSEEIGLMGSPQGHGSKVGEITRAIDTALNNNIMKTTGKFNYLDTQKTMLEPIDELSLGGAQDDVLKDVRDSFSTLKNTPTDAAYRSQLKGKVELFTYSTNSFLSTIDKANHEAVVGAKNSVEEINMITTKIARINEAMGINSQPPLDLLDKRDALEKDLSKYVDFTVDTSGSIYKLTLNSSDTTPIISGTRTLKLKLDSNTQPRSFTNNTGSYNYTMEVATLKMDDSEINLTSSAKGKLLAELDYSKRNSKLEGGKLMMMNFISNLKDDISALKNSDGNGMDIYSIDFTNTNGEYITTGSDDEFDKTDKKMIVGIDGSDGIVALFNKEQVSLGDHKDAPSEKMTLREQENYIRTSMHSMYVNKDEMSKVEKSVVDMYESKYDKLSKVDSSEEMINVMQYQAAYQAGAKMVQVIDEMIQTLLGMKR
jgi:flagellar hook-associated protein 1 FlgK